MVVAVEEGRRRRLFADRAKEALLEVPKGGKRVAPEVPHSTHFTRLGGNQIDQPQPL